MHSFKPFITCILLSSTLALITGTQAQAQENSSNIDKSKAIELFRESIKKNTSQVCNETATTIENTIDRSLACECYAERYVNKYSDAGLIRIVSWMDENPDVASIVVHMLEPERKACKLP